MSQRILRALLPAPRSTLLNLPRYNCSRLKCSHPTPHYLPRPRCIHTSPACFQEEHRKADEGSTSGPVESYHYEEEPKRPFLSYRTAAVIVLTSASFLAYRLFIYSPTSDDQTLSTSAFVSRRLALKQAISPTLSTFTLSPGAGDAADDLWTRAIWSVEFKQPELQIARAYTPLPPVKLREESDGAWSIRPKGLRFLIRREENGEVSPYLHRLQHGSRLELRGPTPELLLPDDVSEVVFLAGGTGIAPAMQVAYALSRRAALGTAGGPGNPVRMSILWSSRTRDDTGSNFGNAGGGTFADRYASIPGQLDAIENDKRAGDMFKLRTQYFVDDEGKTVQNADVQNLLRQRPAFDAPATGRKIVLVSGPDGFVSHVAGPRVTRDGKEEQGPVGGLLGKIDLKGWQVWKL